MSSPSGLKLILQREARRLDQLDADHARLGGELRALQDQQQSLRELATGYGEGEVAYRGAAAFLNQRRALISRLRSAASDLDGAIATLAARERALWEQRQAQQRRVLGLTKVANDRERVAAQARLKKADRRALELWVRGRSSQSHNR